MQKILNFLLIGLIFTVLQVSNVGAQDTVAPGATEAGRMDQGMGNPNQDMGNPNQMKKMKKKMKGMKREMKRGMRNPSRGQ